MMDFSFYTFDQLDAATLYEIIAHRMEVFVLGQGNIYRDLDGFDQKATHLLARDETGALVGYVRLLPAAQIIDPNYQANIMCNWYFMAVSAVFLTFVGTVVHHFFVKPRVGAYPVSYTHLTLPTTERV